MTKSHPSIVGVALEEGTSSGVVVAPGNVATCFHVIRPAINKTKGDGITIRHDGQEYKAHILRADESHDLCLLKVDKLTAPPIMLATTPPKKGDAVTAMGTPAGFFEQKSGHVEHIGLDDPIVFSSAETRPGFSGGALINSKGELAGIAAFSEGHGALPTTWVKELLARKDNNILRGKNPPATDVDYFNCIEAHSWPNPDLPQVEHDIAFSSVTTRRKKLLDEWLANKPESFFANSSLAGFDYAWKRDTDSCLKAAKKAYEINPTVSSLQRIAKISAEYDDKTESIAHYKQLILENPKETYTYLRILINGEMGLIEDNTTLRASELKSLIDPIKALIEKHPERPEYLSSLGHIYFEISYNDWQNPDQQYDVLSKQAFARYDELCPNDVREWNRIANHWFYRAAGSLSAEDHTSALAEVMEAINIATTHRITPDAAYYALIKDAIIEGDFKAPRDQEIMINAAKTLVKAADLGTIDEGLGDLLLGSPELYNNIKFYIGDNIADQILRRAKTAKATHR